MITEAPSTSATFLTTEISSTTPSQPQTTEETTREPLTPIERACYVPKRITDHNKVHFLTCSYISPLPEAPPFPPTLSNITTTTPGTTTSSYTTEISTSSTMITEAPSTSATFLTTEISSTTPSQPQTTEETTREPLTPIAPTLPIITSTTHVTTTSLYATEISSSLTTLTQELSITTPTQPQTTEETTREPVISMDTCFAPRTMTKQREVHLLTCAYTSRFPEPPPMPPIYLPKVRVLSLMQPSTHLESTPKSPLSYEGAVLITLVMVVTGILIIILALVVLATKMKRKRRVADGGSTDKLMEYEMCESGLILDLP
ncbi:uncharacterized protein [Ptychodera flava]|uniref:uncharacterized protein n=1 Tax=Ptychodera flava TaxID=63121 RepID=UPI00396A6CD4